MRSFSWFVVLLWSSTAITAETSIDFDRDIRPILSENCYSCHGPDANNRQADLRLDKREEAIEFGALKPGDPDASELVARIVHDDPDLLMPPPDSHKILTDAQKTLLTNWILEGAEYQPHWSFTPRVRPDVPAIAANWVAQDIDGLPQNPTDWIANPIDAFVLRKLQETGTNPSPSASRDRLRRRVALDLVGLPPIDNTITGIEEEEFEPFVEALFQSPHHGERMASNWLDVVRYADTVGFHGDQTQNVFPYRDWVIESINRNEPFDQFTIAQLAGDLLPTPTDRDRIATGFNRLNMMTREGGAQPGEYLAKYAADRVRTVGMAWMGLTTGCAECHDHKFDPFTAKDFYSLAAYFDDVKQWGVYSDYGYTPNPELKGGNNDYPFYPELEVFSQPLLNQQVKTYRKMVELSSPPKKSTSIEQTSERRAAFLRDMREWCERNPTGWTTAIASSVTGKAAIQTRLSDDSILLTDATVTDEDAKKPVATEFTLSTQPDNSASFDIRSIRITLRDSPDGVSGPMRDGENAATLKFRFFAMDRDGNRRSLTVRRSDANRRHPDYSSTQPVLDVTDRWKLPRHKPNGTVHSIIDLVRDPSQPLTAVYQFSDPVQLADGESMVVELKGGKLARVSFAVSPMVRIRPFDRAEVRDWLLADDIEGGFPAIQTAIAMGDPINRTRIADLERDYRRCRDGWTMTMITQTMKPKATRVLSRGNWQDESGELVQPSPPEFLGRFDVASASGPRQSRMDLARWIVHPDNPLTARVVVNRWWKHFFGTGLTASADDVGAQGEPPSHPELLDWLASELIESGWDRRHVLRLIVTSNTYQQDSRIREELRDVDPNNRLLSFHPPRRLEAEAVRDHALAVAGLLNQDIGGPPTKPYQPPGYYSNLQFPNRHYQADDGTNQYRRGIYMHWQRTFLHPMLANFDAPSREDCVALRAAANTPQQALTLLNDPTFVEAARGLAIATLTANGSDDRENIRSMIERSLQRPATADEIDQLLDFLNQQRDVYGNDAIASDDLMKVGQPASMDVIDQLPLLTRNARSANAEVAAWTATARVLLNLHESITRY